MKLTFLDTIFDGLRTLLVAQIQSFAGQLQVPAEWLFQFLNSHALSAAAYTHSVRQIATAFLQLAMYSALFPGMNMREVLQHMRGSDAPTFEDRMLGDLMDKSGTLNSYYDLFSALSLSEMIGKPDEWAAADGSSRPFTKAAFKQYIRSTVPEENHRLIFGVAAK